MQNKHPKLTTMLALTALVAALSGSLGNAHAGVTSYETISSSTRLEQPPTVQPAGGDPDVPQSRKRLRPMPAPGGDVGKGLVGWRWFPLEGKIWTIWFLSRRFAD